eukprot:CAMPEP_0177401028 /NCGR_PEP_ID=MMETSP0368-20130122/59426_1 /TAXON_ID=447022 ORGANISM="Scrippsiella hangoei-like, Strain SHHI-4" /NCGR_SAMPLE_ID=MMETSP0368 /ASSEMBLY_ACC=CAM_ASM_000363 /LENGTH=149 /DNA_ID=CAMNT_0018868571 /DNA_START=467 /DNA_END=913 /DNA_ORIENTATION=+
MTRPGLEPLAQHPALEFKVAQPLLHTSVTCPLPTAPANPQSALLDAEALQHLERQKNDFSSSVAGGGSPAATGNNVLRKLDATTAASAAAAAALQCASMRQATKQNVIKETLPHQCVWLSARDQNHSAAFSTRLTISDLVRARRTTWHS